MSIAAFLSAKQISVNQIIHPFLTSAPPPPLEPQSTMWASLNLQYCKFEEVTSLTAITAMDILLL